MLCVMFFCCLFQGFVLITGTAFAISVNEGSGGNVFTLPPLNQGLGAGGKESAEQSAGAYAGEGLVHGEQCSLCFT